MWKAAVFEVRCLSRCQRIRGDAQTRGLAAACWLRARRTSVLLRLGDVWHNTAGAGNMAVGHRRVWTLLWERRRSNKRTASTRAAAAAALEMKSSSQQWWKVHGGLHGISLQVLIATPTRKRGTRTGLYNLSRAKTKTGLLTRNKCPSFPPSHLKAPTSSFTLI